MPGPIPIQVQAGLWKDLESLWCRAFSIPKPLRAAHEHVPVILLRVSSHIFKQLDSRPDLSSHCPKEGGGHTQELSVDWLYPTTLHAPGCGWQTGRTGEMEDRKRHPLLIRVTEDSDPVPSQCLLFMVPVVILFKELFYFQYRHSP